MQMDVAPGRVVGAYRLESLLGRGGMGSVYRAVHTALDRPAAVKVISAEQTGMEQLRQRFRREGRLAASLDHPHIVPVYDAGEDGDLLYLAMRLIDGPDLHGEIRRGGPLDPQRAIRVVGQVASALDVAHGAGLVHRDVKPANVLLGGSAECERAYLADFGLTRAQASTRFTRAGLFVGTLDYVAPEQLRGEALDGRADVYSLGCMLYELLCGEVPFPREQDVSKVWAHMNDPPPTLTSRRPGLAPELDEVVARALEKRPGERFSAAGELAEAARRALGLPALVAAPGVPTELDLDVRTPRRSVAPADRAPPPGAPTEGRARRSATDFRPVKSLDRRATNLQTQLTPLIGRRGPLSDVRAMLERDDVRLGTLTGPAGTGKTRLALEAAGQWHEAHGGWAFAVFLAPLADAALVATTMAETLGLRANADESAEDLLERHLRGESALLVVDNFEHVLGAAPFCARLLAACPSLKLLVTSRIALRLSAEHEYPVPPLDLPGDPDACTAGDSEAVRFFVDRARAVRPDFEVTPATVGAVAEICRRLDCLPLAIELAAARAKLLSPEAMLARLEHPLLLLTAGTRDHSERQQTMRATIDWSFRLLSDDERRALTALSVFAGGCTLSAAETVTESTLDVIAALVDASLLRQDDTPDRGPRLFMLETIREYGHEQLDRDGTTDIVSARHARFYLDMVRALGEPYTSAGHDQLSRLEAERDNLRAALRWSIDGDEGALALELAGGLTEFWDVHGHAAEGRAWLEASLTVGGGAPAPVRARGLLGFGRLALVRGDHAAARAPVEACLALYRAMDDPAGTVRALMHLSWLEDDEDDERGALQHAQEALALARTREVDEWTLSRALNFLGMHFLVVGDFDGAKDFEGQSLALRRRLKDLRGMAISLANLSEIALSEGDFDLVDALSGECLSVSRQLSYRELIANSATLLGFADLARGDVRAGAEHLHEALEVAARTGTPQSVADALKGAAMVAVPLDRGADAGRLAAAADAIKTYTPPWEAVVVAPVTAPSAAETLSQDDAVALGLAVLAEALVAPEHLHVRG